MLANIKEAEAKCQKRDEQDQADMTRMTERIEDLEKKYQKQDRIIDVYQKASESYHGIIDRKNEEISALKDELAVHQIRTDQKIEESTQAIHDRYEHLETAVDTLSKENTELRRNTHSLSVALAKAHRYIADLEDDEGNLQDTVARIESQGRQTNRQIISNLDSEINPTLRAMIETIYRATMRSLPPRSVQASEPESSLAESPKSIMERLRQQKRSMPSSSSQAIDDESPLVESPRTIMERAQQQQQQQHQQQHRQSHGNSGSSRSLLSSFGRYQGGAIMGEDKAEEGYGQWVKQEEEEEEGSGEQEEEGGEGVVEGGVEGGEEEEEEEQVFEQSSSDDAFPVVQRMEGGFT